VPRQTPEADDDPALFSSFFTVTDGRQVWPITLIGMGPGRKPLLMFQDDVPPKDAVLWVVKEGIKAEVRTAPGARLKANPQMRPIRLRAGALDKDVPDAGLLVSPDHRMVLRGARARTLFNADEVLVKARDLVNDHTVVRAHNLTHVTYIHMMLEQHEIVFANGVPTESFHPASAALGSLRVEEQQRLLTRVPEIKGNPLAYGGYARRILSASDAAILQADAGMPHRF